MRAHELSVREVMEAHLQRIADVNPQINAIVSLRPERALDEAAAADRRASRAAPGPLHGLPIAIKDLVDTAGITTTYGCSAFADHVPSADALVVRRLRAAGAIVIGKTNTPQFGAGSHTFNDVFGVTRNPWSPSRSAGGSSGGAGAALAAGMVPIADGSDHGGSIRNPASFNNVVGLRPTPGLVPDPAAGAWEVASVLGPMARTVGDLSLILEAIAGPDPRAPLSRAGDPTAFATGETVALDGLRVAWWPDVGGLPIASDVREVLGAARRRFERLGAVVQDVAPRLDGIDEAFEVPRALGFLAKYASAPPAVQAVLKPTIRWNIEQGRGLAPETVARALVTRSDVFRAFVELLGGHDVIVAPAAQVAPFDAEQEYPEAIEGVAMEHYLAWMRACSRVTVSGHPVAAVPAGFTAEALPVGLQLVGRHGEDRRLLAVAAAWEAATGATERRPPLPPAAGRRESGERRLRE